MWKRIDSTKRYRGATAKSHRALLADVEAGHEIVITRRGRPVARLVPDLTVTRSFRLGMLIASLGGVAGTSAGGQTYAVPTPSGSAADL
ncbi:MAG: type II toxin-antitoxin system prevent-host-death family antitoxin [Candidatus Competibacteraceae bacterium]|nr:type II toxin-antitoxin system prevent-host-death family antitoxin [Candidatus Competibacteraceae bacterium]